MRTMLDQIGIRRLLPLREPALHVDRVVELDDEHIVAEKAVSVAEACYPLPSPDDYSYPFALVLESIAQSALIHIAFHNPPVSDAVPLIASITGGRELSSAMPGDVIRHTVRRVAQLESAAVFRCQSWAGNEQVAHVQRLVVSFASAGRFR